MDEDDYPDFPNKIIIGYHEPLGVLPELSENVHSVVCCDQQLTSLPALPSRLQHLICDDNRLVALPPLPPLLKTLSCTDNQLNILPILPAKLEYIEFACNDLRILPEFPMTMSAIGPHGYPALYCRNNKLSWLPIIHRKTHKYLHHYYENNILSRGLALHSALYVRWAEDAAQRLY